MERHLYVIGNGFDIHHGINSSYSDFRKWMEMNNYTVMENFEKVYGECDNEWWRDFENQLASLDIIEYASNIAFENQPDLFSEHYERTWNDAQIEVENQLDSLYTNLRNCFHNWIMQLNRPLKVKKVQLKTENSTFLNFNYTKTLETIYGIVPEKILHIHGCVDEDEEFIIGHGKSLSDLQKDNPVREQISPKGLDDEEDSKMLYEQLAQDATFHGVASQRKSVEDIIKRNENFFANLKQITHVHVFGMSYSPVDVPYLEQIAREMVNVEWEFSDYNNRHKQIIKQFVLNNGIVNYSIIELNDLMLTRNLKLHFEQ